MSWSWWWLLLAGGVDPRHIKLHNMFELLSLWIQYFLLFYFNFFFFFWLPSPESKIASDHSPDSSTTPFLRPMSECNVPWETPRQGAKPVIMRNGASWVSPKWVSHQRLRSDRDWCFNSTGTHACSGGSKKRSVFQKIDRWFFFRKSC